MHSVIFSHMRINACMYVYVHARFLRDTKRYRQTKVALDQCNKIGLLGSKVSWHNYLFIIKRTVRCSVNTLLIATL